MARRKFLVFQTNKTTGAESLNYINKLAKRYGYEFGNAISGNIVGKYPHEQAENPNDFCLDIHPDNHRNILQLDRNGNKRHWMLELHFVDRKTILVHSSNNY